MSGTMVGEYWLPDLPPGTPVCFDFEASGLYVDGDPGTDTTTGGPPARVSAASVAWREPDGSLRSHAWGFDQGPCLSKPGRVRRPSDGGGAEPLDPDLLLKRLFKAGYGVVCDDAAGTLRPYTVDEAYESIGLDHWVRLLRWLQQRDLLVAHGGKYDFHIAQAGPRDELVGDFVGEGDGLAARIAVEYLALQQERGRSVGSMLGVDLDRLEDGSLRPVTGYWDTLLVQAFFEPMQSVALKKTMKRLTGQDADAEQRDLHEAMRKQGVGLTKRFDLTPWPIMRPYAAKDAELGLLLYEHQRGCIDTGAHPPFLWEQIDKDRELMRVLYRMERRGVAYDTESSRAGAAELLAAMERIAGGLPFNPNKLAEVKRFYFGDPAEGGLGLIPMKTTEITGAPCLDESQMRLFVQDGRPHAAEYDEWSHCKSAVGKWYRGWADRTGPDGRLRTVFQQTRVEAERAGGRGGGAISGRLAVGRVQLQAIPHNRQLPGPVRDRPVRSLIRAKPGYALWEMDLPQGEVRIATVIVDCQAMWDVIDTGRDLHGENAKRIFGVDEDHARFKEFRDVAKRIVFGTLYGAGVRTLRAQILEFTGIDYSEAETRAAKEAFEGTFPEFPRVARQIQRKADRLLGGPGYVTLIDGRRRWFGPDEYSHKAFNAVIQGGLAQTGKTWMIEVERRVPDIQVLAIHDSIVVEVEDSPAGCLLAQQVADIGKAVYESDYGVRGRKMTFDIKPERWDKKG